jgi:hypothetical protein
MTVSTLSIRNSLFIIPYQLFIYQRTTMLQSLLTKAYQLFAHYPASEPLDICTACCMEPQEAQRLAKMPVSEIPMDLLRIYTNGAKTDRTPPAELKHFLPRYLELIAQFNIPSHSVEIVLQRLERLSPSEWTPAERQLLNDFADAFWKKCLSQYPLPNGDTIDGFLIMFYKGGFELTPLLQLWQQTHGDTALLHYRDLALLGFQHHKSSPGLQNSFADAWVSQQLYDWAFGTAANTHFSVAIEQAILANTLPEADLADLNWLYELLNPAADN